MKKTLVERIAERHNLKCIKKYLPEKAKNLKIVRKKDPIPKKKNQASVRPDFEVIINDQLYFVESKYQAVSGTVSEKIPGTVRKYRHLDVPVIIVFNGPAFSQKFIDIERNNLEAEGLSNRIFMVSGEDFFQMMQHLASMPKEKLVA